MKKIISISSIAVAAFIVVLLTIAPHHRHGDAICMITEECQQDGCASGNYADHCGIPTDENSSLCIVGIDYFVPAIARDTICKFPYDNSDHSHFYLRFFLATSNCLADNTGDFKTKPDYGEQILFYKSTEASRFHGPRAPPCLYFLINYPVQIG